MNKIIICNSFEFFSKANSLLHTFHIINLNQHTHWIYNRDKVRAQELQVIAIMMLFAGAI